MDGAGKGAPVAVAAAALLVLLVGAPLLVVVLVFAGAGTAQAEASGCGGLGSTGAGQPAGGPGQQVGDVSLNGDQVANATTIIKVAGEDGLPQYAAVIGVATAMQESTLRNVGYGDQAGPDSRGLFQQRAPWGPLSVRMDPAGATRLFFFGGSSPGTPGLTDIPGWQRMPLTQAAQAVQRSAYPDAYARWQPMAQALVDRLWASTTGGAPVGGDPSGPDPQPAPGQSPRDCGGDGGGSTPAEDVLVGDLQLRGSAEGQAAVRYALAQLGKPYRWGAQGPDSFDCSGLTMKAWASAGVVLPRTTYTQVSAGTPEPLTLVAAQSGDLVFIPGSDGTPARPGHVGMVAGWVQRPDGPHLMIVHAPHTGDVVKLVDASSWRSQIVAVRHID